MAGYNGYSMSNNAVEAYQRGEMPLSKWTKTEIIEEIEEAVRCKDLELKCSFSKIKKIPVKMLKQICLYKSSWHHTSNHYNCTDFYSLDLSGLESLTDEKIDAIISDCRREQEKPEEEKWICAFLEWSGTRKHPKATRIVEEGIVKGNWFFRKNGSKKSTKANGFEFIQKVH